MSSVLFLLNKRRSLKTTGTNWTLMRACESLGFDVYVSDVTHLEAKSAASLFAEVVRVPTSVDDFSGSVPLDMSASETRELTHFETIVIRTTPGRDIARAWAHRLTLEVMRLASDLGVNVVNDPVGLQKASSKLYTVHLPPEYVPKTRVCHSRSSVTAFASELGCPFVVKPLLGSQGRDVYFFDSVRSRNLRQVVENLGVTGYLVVQEFLPEATAGDIRVLTLNEGLFVAKNPRGVKRTPADGEIRSNVSLGGTASLVELTSQQVEICTAIAQQLNRDGIRFAGLDMIGNKVVEVNVFSPSGLQELQPHMEVEEWSRQVSRLLRK